MNDFAALAAIILAATSAFLFALALIIKTYRDGSLKADLRWVRLYIRIYLDSKKTPTTN